MNKTIVVIVFLLCAFSHSDAQQTVPRYQLPTDMVSFFCGKWQGEGQFSNGRPIAADVFIHPAADSSWLMYEHTDKAPNSYKAISLWGVEKSSGQFLSYIFFNAQGHNQFESEGWKDNKLILGSHVFNPSKNTTWWQRFIYEKITDNSFKMTWETSTDGNTWKMGDWLTFTRTKG